MAQAMTALQSKLKKAFDSTKRNTPNHPWDILTEPFQAYDASKYAYSLRQNTMPARVSRCAAFINAANLYSRSVHDTNTVPFRMVERRVADTLTTIIEAKKPDDTSFLVLCTGDTLRISSVEQDGSHDPVCSFADMAPDMLTWIALALLPHVLKLDDEQGGSLIGNAVVNICKAADDQINDPWLTIADVPDMAKEAAYFMDAMMDVFHNHMRIDCGNNSSDIPDELPDAYFVNPSMSLSGALLCEYVEENGWQPKLVTANGNGRRFASSRTTIADAKAMFAHFTAHRKWTAEEKKLICKFPDDMPVMPETMMFAKRICDTRNDTNPVVNMMWRGVTAYGKSTGIKQLSCILNIPLLILTCWTEMEASDFRSSYVPDGQTEDLLVNTNNLRCISKTAFAAKPELPFFDDVVSHFETLEEQEQNELLDQTAFFENLLMDTDYAVSMMLGREEPIPLADACALYSSFLSWRKESALQARIMELEAAAPAKEEKSNQPSFVHVLSPFVKAILNGYLIEVQEPSRIRNSGVLVGNNEILGNAGSSVTLMNGWSAVRHQDALVVLTDNVGYASCHAIDPSVLRRMGFIRDSDELPKDLLMDRVKRNTGVTDSNLLERCWKVWNAAKEFCEHNQVTEGTISPMELERLVQAIKYDGESSFQDNLQDCIISKASSSREDQREILAACTLVA